MALRTLTEDRPAGFIVSESNGRRSREQISLAATTVALRSGTVLGKVTATGAYVPYAPAAVDGSQNFAGILFEGRPIDTAAQRAVAITRQAEVDGRKLVFVNALTAAQLTALEAAAAGQGVLVRY